MWVSNLSPLDGLTFSTHFNCVLWLGEGPQTSEMPAFRSLQDLMSISCLKQLKMEPLTNWEWSPWCNVNYGGRGGTIRAAGPKNQWLAGLLQALWHQRPQRVSDNVNMRQKRTETRMKTDWLRAVCVFVLLWERSTISPGHFVSLWWQSVKLISL